MHLITWHCVIEYLTAQNQNNSEIDIYSYKCVFSAPGAIINFILLIETTSFEPTKKKQLCKLHSHTHLLLRCLFVMKNVPEI